MVLQQRLLTVEDHDFPALPNAVWAAGRIEVLREEKTAFFCSSQCPGSVILKTFDVMTAWRDDGRIVAGGFHSPMEQECLGILLRGRQAIIWTPARSIHQMRLKPELRRAFEEGRILILSPFEAKEKRITAALARQRNDFLGAISDGIFVAHAATGSRTLELCRKLTSQKKPFITVDDPANQPLFDLGASRIALRAESDHPVTAP